MDTASINLVNTKKLDTRFHLDRVEHRILTSDQSRGLRRIETIETWTRVRELGADAFARIFLETEASGKLRAVKEIRKSKNMTEISFLFRENLAVAFSATDDACFVQLGGWFFDESRIYITMEYFELGDLGACLSAPLLEPDAKEILLQVTEALSFIHRKGLGHRSIKPQNVFVVESNPRWWVKVGDFGTSKQALEDDTSHSTSTWSAYLAPELMSDDGDGSKAYTCAVDVWSLGCLSYWLVTKEDQFGDISDLRKYCRTSDLNTLELISRGITYPYRKFLRSCLTVAAQDRPTADQLLHADLFGDADTADAVQGSSMSQHRVRATEGSYSIKNEAGPLETLPGYEKSAVDLKSQAEPKLRESYSNAEPSNLKNYSIERQHTALTTFSQTDKLSRAPTYHEEDPQRLSYRRQEQLDAPQNRSFFKQARQRLTRAFHGEKSTNMNFDSTRVNNESGPSGSLMPAKSYIDAERSGSNSISQKPYQSRRGAQLARAFRGQYKSNTSPDSKEGNDESAGYRRPSSPPCYHKLLTSCSLINPNCCACLDTRPYADYYSGYSDGIGDVGYKDRWRHYCPSCQRFWKKRPNMTEKSVNELKG